MFVIGSYEYENYLANIENKTTDMEKKENETDGKNVPEAENMTRETEKRGEKKETVGEYDNLVIHRHYGIVFIEVKAVESESSSSSAIKKCRAQLRKGEENFRKIHVHLFEEKNQNLACIKLLPCLI